MDSFFNILFFFLTGLLCSVIAAKKGRDSKIWFVLGVLFSVLAVLLLVFLPPVKPLHSQGKRQEKSKDESLFSGTTIDVKPLGQESDSSLPLDYKNKDWFYLDDVRQQAGPIALSDVKNLYKQEVINDSTYLWCDGMKEWRKLSDLKLKMND